MSELELRAIPRAALAPAPLQNPSPSPHNHQDLRLAHASSSSFDDLASLPHSTPNVSPNGARGGCGESSPASSSNEVDSSETAKLNPSPHGGSPCRQAAPAAMQSLAPCKRSASHSGEFCSGGASRSGSGGAGRDKNGITSSLYHEPQVGSLCALHALNCILQRRAFTEQRLDQINNRFSEMWMDNETPPLGTEFESRQNKCWAGFKQKLFSCFERLDSYLFGVPMKPEDASGNYDINVMMVAMEEEGYQLCWYDKRQLPLEKHLSLDTVDALLLNVWRKRILPQRPWLCRLLDNCFQCWPKPLLWERHWMAIRAVGGVFYDFDSLLPEPVCMGSHERLYAYLYDHVVHSSGAQILIVYTTDNPPNIQEH